MGVRPVYADGMNWTAEDEKMWTELAEMEDEGAQAIPNEDSGTSLLQMEAVHSPYYARLRGNIPS